MLSLAVVLVWLTAAKVDPTSGIRLKSDGIPPIPHIFVGRLVRILITVQASTVLADANGSIDLNANTIQQPTHHKQTTRTPNTTQSK